ncbi:MAG TPA: biotin--[acetyl-CoA-carboxylase] ligase [Salinisphaeraceae bacterium]|nr:biotin--[acetyl-CoA-carboxylase] ligase [Salinisphaeraceae bacterium]
MNADNPLHGIHLPAAYEPVHLPACDSVQAEAVRRARAGAPEGTLVWAGEQTAACGRLHSHWLSPAGGMYCAVVLRPELPTARLGEFVPLATVAMGAACAELVSAMTDLRYRWPNAVYLSGARASGSWLSYGPEWLVLTSAVNVLPTAAEDDFRHACLRTEGGNEAVTVATALEAYIRHLTAWLMRWDEEGFVPVLRSLRSRAQRPGDAVRLRLSENDALAGTFASINEHGAMCLTAPDGAHEIGINQFMALPVC